MKKLTILAAAFMMATAAFAQKAQYVVRDFVREMPCTNNRGEVIATQVGTICLPYAPTMVEGATLYELVSASANEWVFVTVSDPQANTPYVYRVNNDAQRVVFYGEGNYDRNEVVVGSAAGCEGAFVGTYRSRVVQQPLYYIANDKVCYTEEPINGTQFRCYFTTDVMPEGEVLSDNVQMTFTTPAALREMGVAEQQTIVERHNVGLQQGEYQLGGKKVMVK